MKEKIGKAKASTKFSSGAGDEVVEVVPGLRSEGALANVGVSIKSTRNLGDYNSVSFEVSMHLPCDVTDEAVDAAFERAKAWCDARLDDLLSDVDDVHGGE